MNEKEKMISAPIEIRRDYIEAQVQDIVKSAIVSALGDPSKLVKKAIDNTINSYVDENGKTCSKDWRSKPYLDWLAETTVKNVVREAMEEAINENKDEFKEEIKHQLRTKRFKERTAQAFIDTMIKDVESGYMMPIKVEFEKVE